MPTYGTYQERIACARESGAYEHLRAPLQNLIAAGYARRELHKALGIGSSTAELAMAALDLHTHGRAGRPRNDEINEITQDLADQRVREHHWVKLFRDTYGSVGKGFSTA